MDKQEPSHTSTETTSAYRRSSLTILFTLLGLWFLASFGCGILFCDQLNKAYSIGSAPFGFWMAQQGSIVCFVLILIAYSLLMNRLDRKHGYSDKPEA